jgi:hypothetical protein
MNIDGCHLVLKALTSRLVENYQTLDTVSLEDTILTTKPVLLPEDMRFSTAIKQLQNVIGLSKLKFAFSHFGKDQSNFMKYPIQDLFESK